MKRDFDLIRRIMTDIESMPAGEKYTDISSLTEYEPAVVYSHIDLLLEAELIKGRAIKTMGGIAGIIITGLTWKGHDFLEAARDNSIWDKAKEKILKPGVSVTFDILIAWLKAEAKEKLGIP
jgi:hypothetical protein